MLFCGCLYFCIEVWIDCFVGYCCELCVKYGVCLLLDLELCEGDELLQCCVECGGLEIVVVCVLLVECLQVCQSVEEWVVLWLVVQIGELLCLVGLCEYLVCSCEYLVEVE